MPSRTQDPTPRRRQAGQARTLCTVLMWAAASTASAQDISTRAEQVAAGLASELARLCPPSDAADQAAFDACRGALFRDSQFKRSLQDFVLWGRQRNPQLALKDSSLTQLGPDVLAGLYVPLFMFDGRYSVGAVTAEGLVPIRLNTAFRNRLAPGQFPYPFWHDAEKWSMYENANQMLLFWNPRQERITHAQFSVFGSNAPVVATRSITPPAFDGQWRWTDSSGHVQPAVTLFDGLMDPANPHLPQLDATYKKLALRLREGQCFDCHVPNNPDRSRRLVLLQTPVHAAGEIKRLMTAVRKDTMPRDEAGIEQPLDAHAKAALLQEGAAFELALDLAKRWESQRAMAGASPGAGRGTAVLPALLSGTR